MKGILKEDKYRLDGIIGQCVRDIMDGLKRTQRYTIGHPLSLSFPHDINGEEDYIIQRLNLPFNIECTYVRVPNFGYGYEVNGWHPEEEDVIEIQVIVDPKQEPSIYENVYHKLQEVVRHELEHILQENRVGDRPEPEPTADDETTYEHHIKLSEVPALVQGYYRKAKMKRLPLDEIMMEDLDNEIEQGNLTTDEAQELFRVFVSYAKRRLPKAIFVNESSDFDWIDEVHPSLEEYIDFIKKNNIGTWDFDEHVEGSLDLRGTLIKSLGNLQTVGGDLYLRRTLIKSLGNLQSVDGYLDLEGTKIKSLGNLESVGGYLYLEGTPIQDLGNLQSVGGSLNLYGTQIKSLGNLQTVGGNLYLVGTPLSKKYSKEEIRQMINVGGDIHM